jgi:3-oxoacyl-[acyl-carrier protein] reductase
MNSRELEGRVSLVTGGSRGLGRAIAIRLAVAGSKVAVNYLNSENAAREVVDNITSGGGEALLAQADISDAAAVRTMTRDIVKQWEKIDILVNNAGIVRDNLLLRMPDDAWDEVINTNLRGVYLCTKYALRSMIGQSWGRIINVSSLAGMTGNPGQANYSAAKGGLNAFTRSVAREVGPMNITVNAIAPGFIVTDMTDALSQETRDFILGRIPLNRFGQPDDVAELAAFLASDRAAYITAQIISVDGGVI